MSRSNRQTHLQRHRVLRELWLFVPSIYSMLLPTQQWEVHRLYDPSEFFEDDELLAFVKTAIQREASLPNRVGKHWKRIHQVYAWASTVAEGPDDWRGIHKALVRARVLGQVSLDRLPPSTPKKSYVVRVAPIMNPQVNVDKLAWALMEQARLMREEDRSQNPSEPSSQ